MTFKKWIKDTFERSSSTLIQSMIAYFLAAQASDYGNWKAILAAVFPALGSVILNAVTTWVPTFKIYWEDVAYRIARTMIVTVLGAVVADNLNLLRITTWRTAFIAGTAAVLVTFKSEIAKRIANTITPASLAKEPVPTTPAIAVTVPAVPLPDVKL